MPEAKVGEVLIANKQGEPVGQIDVLAKRISGNNVTYDTQVRNTTSEAVAYNTSKPVEIVNKNDNVVGKIKVTTTRINGADVTYDTKVQSA